jgi:hypothetical protein
MFTAMRRASSLLSNLADCKDRLADLADLLRDRGRGRLGSGDPRPAGDGARKSSLIDPVKSP